MKTEGCKLTVIIAEEGLEYFCNQSHKGSVTKRGVAVKVKVVVLLFGDAVIQRIRRGR